MAITQRDPTDVVLTVVCTDPDQLRPWLPPDAAGRLPLVDAANLHVHPLPRSARSDTPAPAERGMTAVHLVLDGPGEVLGYAAAELARWLGPMADRYLVVARGPADGPPDPQQLGVLADAGLLPAVDLNSCQWASEVGAWITGPAGCRFVDVQWTRRLAGPELGQLLGVTTSEETPLAHWLATAPPQGRASRPDQWVSALQALYLENALQTLNLLRRR